jgi:phage gp45-like
MKSIVRRGAVSLAGDDSKDYLVFQAKYFGRASNVHAIYPYGFCGNPPVDSLVHILAINGNEENKAGIANHDTRRFKDLEPWEVALGNYLTRSRVKFLNNGDIEIFSANDKKILVSKDMEVTVGGNVTINVTGTADVTSTGAMSITAPTLTIDADTAFTGTLTSNGKNISDSHSHTGSPTAPLGGVSNTGGVV